MSEYVSCCRKIKEIIDYELIGSWNCIAFYKNIGSHYHLRNLSVLLDIKFGKLSFYINKVYDEVLKKKKIKNVHFKL
jgi:hypothetical protein